MAERMKLWNVALLGDGGVGKTTTIDQHVVDDVSCIIDYLELPGQNEYTALRDQWCRDADAFMIMYSISSRASFNKIKEYRHQILNARAQPHKPYPGTKPVPKAGREMWNAAPTILVGNKNDLDDMYREVSFQEGEALARELGIDFMESTAKSLEATMKPIEHLIRHTREWSDEIDKVESESKIEAEAAAEPKSSSRSKGSLTFFKDLLRKIKRSTSSTDDAKARPRRRRTMN